MIGSDLAAAATAFARCRPGTAVEQLSTARALELAALRYGQEMVVAALPTRGAHLALLDADERLAGRLPW